MTRFKTGSPCDLCTPLPACRADAINACFSLHTVEAILAALKRLSDSVAHPATHSHTPADKNATATAATTDSNIGNATSSGATTASSSISGDDSSSGSSGQSHLFPAELATPQNARWATETHATLLGCSPTSLRATLRSVREGRHQALARCLQREFRLSVRALMCTATSDLYEGVRARLVDKDGAPKVSP